MLSDETSLPSSSYIYSFTKGRNVPLWSLVQISRLYSKNTIKSTKITLQNKICITNSNKACFHFELQLHYLLLHSGRIGFSRFPCHMVKPRGGSPPFCSLTEEVRIFFWRFVPSFIIPKHDSLTCSVLLCTFSGVDTGQSHFTILPLPAWMAGPSEVCPHPWSAL